MPRKSIDNSKREQIVGLSFDKTKNNCDIAKLVGVSEKCVRTTLKNYKATGQAKELPRPGRAKRLNYRDEHHIVTMVKKDPTLSLNNIADSFNQSFPNHTISHMTVKRTLSRHKIGSYVAARKPLLTIKDRL